MRVVTFNIHHGTDAADRPRLDAAARVIAGAAPDLVLVQEVDRFWERSGLADQPALLAEALGMHLAFAPALRREAEAPGGREREYGHAILSRAPLQEVRVVALPGAADAADGAWTGGGAEPGGADEPNGWEEPRGTDEPRALLVARTVIGGTALTVAGTHLEPRDATLRARQAREVLDALAEVEGPIVLGGDLNAAIGDPALAVLAERFAIPSLGADAAPSFVGAGHDPHAARIDWVLAAGLAVGSATVLGAGEGVSDHLPVVVELGV